MTVYEYQQRSLPVLLGWAAGSIVTGILWLLRGEPFWRGLGSQFAGWGAIDGLIGLLALSGARRKGRRWQEGRLSAAQHAREAQQFEKIIWANVALDAGYVWGGRLLSRRSPGQPLRQGMGAGIQLQGAFLLAWDVLLALLLRRHVALLQGEDDAGQP